MTHFINYQIYCKKTNKKHKQNQQSFANFYKPSNTSIPDAIKIKKRMHTDNSYRNFCQIYFELFVQGLNNKEIRDKHPKLSKYKMPHLFTPTWEMIQDQMEKYGLSEIKEIHENIYEDAKSHFFSIISGNNRFRYSGIQDCNIYGQSITKNYLKICKHFYQEGSLQHFEKKEIVSFIRSSYKKYIKQYEIDTKLTNKSVPKKQLNINREQSRAKVQEQKQIEKEKPEDVNQPIIKQEKIEQDFVIGESTDLKQHCKEPFLKYQWRQREKLLLEERLLEVKIKRIGVQQSIINYNSNVGNRTNYLMPSQKPEINIEESNNSFQQISQKSESMTLNPNQYPRSILKNTNMSVPSALQFEENIRSSSNKQSHEPSEEQKSVKFSQVSKVSKKQSMNKKKTGKQLQKKKNSESSKKHSTSNWSKLKSQSKNLANKKKEMIQNMKKLKSRRDSSSSEEPTMKKKIKTISQIGESMVHQPRRNSGKSSSKSQEKRPSLQTSRKSVNPNQKSQKKSISIFKNKVNQSSNMPLQYNVQEHEDEKELRWTSQEENIFIDCIQKNMPQPKIIETLNINFGHNKTFTPKHIKLRKNELLHKYSSIFLTTLREECIIPVNRIDMLEHHLKKLDWVRARIFLNKFIVNFFNKINFTNQMLLQIIHEIQTLSAKKSDQAKNFIKGSINISQKQEYLPQKKSQPAPKLFETNQNRDSKPENQEFSQERVKSQSESLSQELKPKEVTQNAIEKLTDDKNYLTQPKVQLPQPKETVLPEQENAPKLSVTAKKSTKDKFYINPRAVKKDSTKTVSKPISLLSMIEQKLTKQ